MAGRPYSVRFLHGRGAGTDQSYTVPAGRRAVVRFAAISAFAAAGQSAFVFTAGAVVLYWLAPGANTAAFWEVRMVAYAGETVRIITNGSDVAYHISGFLFVDDLGRDAALDDELGELEHELPALA